MNKTVIAVFFLSSAAAFVPFSAAWSQGSISLQDVDTNKDGVVSPEESRAYIMRLEQAHDFEAQKARSAAQLQMDAERAAAVQAAAAAAVPAPAPVALEPEKADETAAPPPAVDAEPKPMARTVENAPANDQKKLDKRLQEMKTLDLNNDGILQASELQGATTKKFEAADTNKDGVISPEEAAAAMEQFSQQQEEAYGKAAVKQEAGRLKNRLKSADTNRDGQISKEEYETFMNERQSLFDRDGDGIITEEEYRTDGEKLPSTYRKNTRDK